MLVSMQIRSQPVDGLQSVGFFLLLLGLNLIQMAFRLVTWERRVVEV